MTSVGETKGLRNTDPCDGVLYVIHTHWYGSAGVGVGPVGGLRFPAPTVSEGVEKDG